MTGVGGEIRRTSRRDSRIASLRTLSPYYQLGPTDRTPRRARARGLPRDRRAQTQDVAGARLGARRVFLLQSVVSVSKTEWIDTGKSLRAGASPCRCRIDPRRCDERGPPRPAGALGPPAPDSGPRPPTRA